jgi:predicted nuclease of predicted toxin-antitoxin system
MTFHLDENLSPRIADILRARGLDVVSAHEAEGFRRLEVDGEVLLNDLICAE